RSRSAILYPHEAKKCRQRFRLVRPLPPGRAGALHLFTTTQKICQFIDYLFAGADLPGKETEATAQLLTDFDRAEDEVRSFLAGVDGSFPGRFDLANKKEQSE